MSDSIIIPQFNGLEVYLGAEGDIVLKQYSDVEGRDVCILIPKDKLNKSIRAMKSVAKGDE